MHWWPGGFIPIILYYTNNAPIAIQNALLTEGSDDILAENSDFLEVETV